MQKSRPLGKKGKDFLNRGGFTIVEVLLASTVLVILLGILLSTISQTSSVTKGATEKITSFQTARAAFDIMSYKLAQATLNSYWDFDNPINPTSYLLKSELNFLIANAGEPPIPGTPGTGQAVFFQAPLGLSTNKEFRGLDNLLNACGYFISYGEVDSLPSPFTKTDHKKYRYQLMQVIQPAESLQVYQDTNNQGWIFTNNPAPIAENIIYIAIWPRMSETTDPNGTLLSTDFTYDSREGARATNTTNQLPPTIQLTMVAIDEAAAARYCITPAPPSQIKGIIGAHFAQSDASQFARDKEAIERILLERHIGYRIFTTVIPLRESKME